MTSSSHNLIFDPLKLLDDMITFVAVLDPSGTIIFVNNTPLNAIGVTLEEVKGTKFYDAPWWAYSQEAVNSIRQDIELCTSGKSILHEIQLATADGTLIWIEYSMHPILSDDGEVEFLVPEGRDITEKKKQQEQLKLLANYDCLTGLPNRNLFSDRFDRAILNCDRDKTLLAVCFLDLDNFKSINDTLGHTAGDSLLLEVSKRITKRIRAVDTVSRLGGDEFAILLSGLKKRKDVEISIQRILYDLSSPYTIENTIHKNLSASCGITLYPNDDSNPDQLIRNADQAMYKAKLSGKNKFLYYDLKSELSKKEHQINLNRISKALESNEMVLYYQPKVNMSTGKVHALEALIRWEHPEKGLLSPFHFLPQLEKMQLMIDIGKWVIKEALDQLEQWLKEGKDWAVSINIDADHLMDTNFFTYLKAQLQTHPSVQPKSLEIEILETVSFSDIKKVADVINRCSNLGVSFALDDFGTGYSSLTYLKELPVHCIKIDQSFVRDMLVDEKDLTLIKGVIALAKAFKRDIIAEGVETLAQGLALARLGCFNAQGYYIAKPMPSEEVIPWEENYIPEKQWLKTTA